MNTLTHARPDVSVIIASHDRLWALPEAVESCRGGRCRIEIVVVDDGSTDATWSWLQKQPDVISLRKDHWGKCWAVNAGFAASSGEYVRFLDSDDWLLPGASDRQLEVARATRADVVVAGHVSRDEASGLAVEVPPPAGDDFLAAYLETLASETDSHYGAFLVRRSFVAGIPHRQEFPWDDSMFLIEVGLASPKVASCDFPALAYREHERDRRVSDREGFDAADEAWRTIAMYRKTLDLMRRQDACTGRRMHALLSALWPQVRRLARWNVREAAAVSAWMREQDPGFLPPVHGGIGLLYRTLGFASTERLAGVYRRAVSSLRRVRTGS